ncbi:MAG: flagellar biosynthetic protein FliO [Deltaproteobacteria bacterium]|nr:flagellar biosynthetic protein FliO [Deltaproteobacteria bacterium]
MTGAILKMILVLGTILLSLFLLARLMRKNRMMTGGPSNHAVIRVLATQYLAPQKYLSLVEMGGEVLALGISEAHVTLLTKIENKEFIEKISCNDRLNQSPSFPFHFFQPHSIKPNGLIRRFWRRVYEK